MAKTKKTKQKKLSSKIQVGSTVLAKWTEDGVWYRARVDEIEPETCRGVKSSLSPPPGESLLISKSFGEDYQVVKRAR